MSLSKWIAEHMSRGHRALIEVNGSPLSCRERCAELVERCPEAWRVAVLSASPELSQQLSRRVTTLSWSSSRALLGRSVELLVIELFEGLNPDALGATLGAVRGGGVVLLMGPDEPPRGALLERLLVWPHPLEAISDHYGRRWWAELRATEACYRLSAQAFKDELCVEAEALTRLLSEERLEEGLEERSLDSPVIDSGAARPSSPLSSSAARCLNLEQQAVIEATLSSQARRGFTAVSVTASRGRGKSYALGLAAGALLLSGERELYVTAPRPEALETLFEAAYGLLEAEGAQPKREALNISSQIGVIKYVSPAVLWARELPFKTLFVDEAASLPVPLLLRLLEGRPKLIFATTTHGYEGAGRGFSLRFRPHLQRALKKLYELSLTSPIRWREGDPVEAWSFSSLMLDASASLSRGQTSAERCVYRCWDRAALSRDEPALRELFGLLVTAHYRTTPSDAWRLLDAPNLSVHSLSDERGLAAVALISEEGALTPALAAEVYEGRARPRGQLFAANFAVHLNCERAAQLKMARVVRVATRPQDQSRGLGSALIRRVERWAQERGVELFGSSFGVTAQLLRFWMSLDFKPLRVSVRQSDMSGERSALVCKGLSARAQELLASLEAELTQDFEAQLRGPLRHLDLGVAVGVLSASVALPDPRLQLSERSWRALCACAFAGRAFELSERGAHALALCAVSVEPVGATLAEQARALKLSEQVWRLYLSKALLAHRWLELTRAERLDGPAVAMKAISEAQRALLWRYAPAWLLEEARRFPRFEGPRS